ncbi:hypothetical protein [Streptomyces sp. NPDC049879]|uniref:hypothetical protein n=1 Tax=Streptomyces sp. NPDC049879 TaxID=3365598 RepID=UPI003798133D
MSPSTAPVSGASQSGASQAGPHSASPPGGPFRDDDPAAVERAGDALAALAAPYAPRAVVSRGDTADVLLAHVVARTLGVRRHVVVADLGRLIVEDLPPGTRAVLVTGGAPDGELGSLVRAVTSHGGEVAAVCSLTPPSGRAAHPEGVEVAHPGGVS